MNILNKKFDAKVKEIVLLHNITKHYIILGEETDLNFNSYLQPIKEFRDAYDHLLRIFKNVLFENKTSEEYIEKQLSKALGHEYRAFFDVADWFSLICRKSAFDAIQNKTQNIKELIKKYPKYSECVKLLNDACKKIADIRNQKDIGDKIADIVNEYQVLLSDMHEATLYIRNATITIDDE